MNEKQTRVLLLISEAEKGYDLYRSAFEELEQGYLNNLHPSLLKSLKSRRKSHITPQIIKAKVRKVMISVMKTYFENDEFAKLVPEYTNAESFEDVEKLQKALDNWTTKRINLYTRFKPAIIDGLVYGTPIIKIYWSGKHLAVTRVKIKDLHLDPNATNVFDIQYCVHRIHSTVGKLRKQFGRKFKWKNYIGQTDGRGNGQVSTIDIGDASRVEVRDVYRFQDGKWLVSTVLPDQTFIRTDEVLKDGLPFIIGNIDPQFVSVNENNSVEAYGASFIEGMIPLQEEYTITRNQQIDAIDKTFNPQYLATKTSGLNESDLASGRKKVLVSQLSEVEQVPIPRVDPSIFHTDRLDSELQEVSGVTKASQGMVDSSSKYQTATGMSILSEEGNVVIGDIIRALNESFFEPAIRRMVRLIYKYDETPLLYDVDRKKNIKFFVSINAGVGAVNGEILLNNITQAEGSAMQNAKTHLEMQDIEGAKRYLEVLDKLFEEKLKALRLKNLIPTLKGETHEQQEQQQAGADGSIGGGAISPDDATGLGGLAEQQGVSDIPNGANGEVQQPI
jgi:hypothetical protein